MSGTFTSIDNQSAWQVNFDDAGFGSAFASNSSPMAPTSATSGGGFADFDLALGGGDMVAPASPAHVPATASMSLSQQPSWSAGFAGAGGSVVAPGQAQASWAPMPSPVLGRFDGAAPQQQQQQQQAPLSAPAVSSSAPRVHIRSAAEVSGTAVAVDLCSLAPPPPVANRQQKTSLGAEGATSAMTISRHRPGTERGPRRRRHSSVDDDGPGTTEIERQRRQPGRHSMATSQSFELPSPNWNHADSATVLPRDWSGVPSGADGRGSSVGSSGPSMLQPEASAWGSDQALATTTQDHSTHVSLLDNSLPASGLSMALNPTTDSTGVYLPSMQSMESPPMTHDPMAALQPQTASQAKQVEAPAQSQVFAAQDEWTISAAQQEYYESQFRNLAENQDVVTGTKARGFFLKSRLPAAELSQIWRLSDVDSDGALNSIEFCIAMQLVFARRRAVDLPDGLPAPLVQFRHDSLAAASGGAASSGNGNVAAPSPSQMPLLSRTPEPSDSDSDDEPAALSTTVTDGSEWQGSTLSTEADGKPPLRPKPGPATGSKVPERPSHPPRRQPASPASPLQQTAGKAMLPPRRSASDVVAPAAVKPARPHPRSSTLGRGLVQPLEADRSSTGWSTSAGDLLGRHEVVPEPAPRVPKRTPTSHHRGGSVGDPRLMATITSDFSPSSPSPSLPPREKQLSEKSKSESRSPLQGTAGGELESLLEGRASEIKKMLESKENSPVHRSATAPAPHSIPVSDGTVAATAAGLAHVLQGAPMSRPGPRPTERKPMEPRPSASDPTIVPTPASPTATINRRVVRKPERPAGPAPRATHAESTREESTTSSSTDNTGEESIYASAIPKSKRGCGSGVAAFADRTDSSRSLTTEGIQGDDVSGPSLKRKISKCRDQLLALSAVNQELQSELYQARERRLALQYELERLQGGQSF